LKHKFKSFSKLYEIARKIQETKLHKHGLADRLNANMCKFSLNVNHGWIPKSEKDLTTKGESLNRAVTEENLKIAKKFLDENY